jgi:CheY-like chemotaxis protein
MTTKKVILVEDDPDDQDLFATFLSKRKDLSLLPIMGNGFELLEYLEQSKPGDLPDLIVLDQNMPMLNGKQTLSFLKSDPRYVSIPAVIYSTYTDTNLIIDCTNLGASMVAVKPIDRGGYQKMMDDFLQLL